MIGFWKSRNKGNVLVSHGKGLDVEQVQFLHNLRVGDKLVLFENDVREGERSPVITLKRSNLVADSALKENV